MEEKDIIVPGYHIPPVMFTTSEAAALLTGEKLINSMGDSSIKSEFNNALTKIRAVLKEKEKEKLEELETSIHISNYATRQENPSPWLTKVQEALIDSNELKIYYFSSYNEKEAWRIICPIGLCYYSDSWHLIAFCKLRNDYRDFRVDRIQKLEITNTKFNKSSFSSLQEYLDKTYSHDDLKKVTIRFKKAESKYLQRQKYLYGLVKEIEKGDYIEMTFLTHSYGYFAKWLLMYSTAVEVVKPEELTELLISYSKVALEHFQNQLVLE
jgi:predicted DNA-binding transcriptional regulator YafY